MRMLMTRVMAIVGIVIVAGALPAMAQAPPTGAKQAVVTVKGMQCPFCAYGIKKQLAKVPGARKVDVDLAKNQAIVEFAPDATPTEAQIRQAVHDAGFTAGKIEWRSAGRGDKAGALKPVAASTSLQLETS